jgi:YVTN family beta-propeller protein
MSNLRELVAVALGCSVLAAACEEDGAADGEGDETAESADSGSTGGEPRRWVVTADFLAGTLSLLDYDALVGGVRERDALLVDTIDLSAYPPGPIEVEIAPDGHTAFVSISPGFFDTFVGQAIGITEIELAGTAVVVDLDTREIVGELDTPSVPLGFVFTPDGTRALSANFGYTGATGSTVSIIDVATLDILDEVEVGGGPEQLSVDETGELVIVNVDELDAIRIFSLSDPAGTLSDPLVVADDPSGVAFVPGTDLAVVANSLGDNGWSVIDVSDPSAPVVLDTTISVPGFPYGATWVPGSTDVLITLASDPETTYVRLDPTTTPASIVWMQSAPLRSFPLGIAVDVDAGFALSGAVGGDALAVVPLDGGPIESIPWPDPGPSYVAIGPPRE